MHSRQNSAAETVTILEQGLPVTVSKPLEEESTQWRLPRLFTEQELSAMGYGSRSKLRKDRMNGVGLPFIYIGSAVRYRETDILSFLESNMVTHALQRPPEIYHKAKNTKAAKRFKNAD